METDELPKKKKIYEYVLSPRWRIIQTRLKDMKFDHLDKKEKEIVRRLKNKIKFQLKRIERLEIIILVIYALIYFSIISVVMSFSQIINVFENIISKFVNIIGVPILFILAYLVKRMIDNRYEDTRILLTELISIKNKK